MQAGRYGGMKLDQQVMTRRINWLNSIRTWQSEFVNSLSAREFVDCITDDLLGRGVFVFTPSGEVMRLPKVRLRCLALHPLCLIDVLTSRQSSTHSTSLIMSDAPAFRCLQIEGLVLDSGCCLA